MKKKLFILMAVVIVTSVSGYGIYQGQYAKSMSNVAMANVEALASIEYDGECLEWVDKACWDHFSLQSSLYYYATCSGQSSVPGGKLECGAVSSYEPTTPWGNRYCLQCVRTANGRFE